MADIIIAGGEPRICNRQVTPHEVRRRFVPFSAANPVIPRSKWLNFPARVRPNVPILDQDGRGACVGHGSCTALMLARDIAGGTFQLLSPCFIYAQINGGIDEGANLGDAANSIQSKGACLMTEFPEPNYLARNIPASAYITALRFKVLDIYALASFDESVSASALGFAVFDSIQCGNDFSDLDSDGVPPLSRGMGNHCIANDDFEVKQVNGRWLLRKRNSWAASWGLNGLFWETEEHVTAQGSYWEGYAIRVATIDPQDPILPPVLS
jgi:hypothetical protein